MAGIDLSKEIGIVREYLHKQVRESYSQLHSILNSPAIKDPKERTGLIAGHLIKCLPKTPEERMVAATIISLNSKDRYEAFNAYAEDVHNEHVLLTMGNGGSTSFALDRPAGYHFNYEDGKCIVKYDSDFRRRRFHRDDDSGSEEDAREHEPRTRDNYRPRGRGGFRGRGRGRGNFHNRHTRVMSERREVVTSEQTTVVAARESSGIETDNKFDALVEHSRKGEKSKNDNKNDSSSAPNKSKEDAAPKTPATSALKNELVKDGERRTKEMVKNNSGKTWAEMADDSGDKDSDAESEKEPAKKN